MDLLPKARANSRAGTLIILVIPIFLGLGVANKAFAQVAITEIMYDAPGGDEGHEWLEIENKGSNTQNIGAYSVFESGTNHKLISVRGSTLLEPGATALITTNPDMFAVNFPQYSGSIFKASLNLSNSGEDISLKNASSSIVDTVSYSASMGAMGDGATLHRVPSGFSAGKPDPGVYTEAVTPLQTNPTPVQTQKTTSNDNTIVQSKKSSGALPTPKSQDSLSESSSTPQNSKATELPASAALSTTQDSSWLTEGVLALIALVLLGVMSVYYSRAMVKGGGENTQLTPEEFEIES